MQISASTLDSVQIGIATKNRWNELAVTIEKIAEFGLGDARIVVIDDHSDEACPFDTGDICPNLEIIRKDRSEGYIARRNEIARTLDSKYYLSLDDDSFPTHGSLDSAVEYANSLGRFLGLSFPVYNPVRMLHQLRSLKDEPYRCRGYVGCSHMLNRLSFLDIEGYREELVHQGEEMDAAARAFEQGLYCWHFPQLGVDHTATRSSRSFYRMDYYGGRNQMLWNDWYLPPDQKAYRQFRTIAERLLFLTRTRRVGHLYGVLAGVADIRRYRRLRSPMTSEMYWNWRSLPIS